MNDPLTNAHFQLRDTFRRQAEARRLAEEEHQSRLIEEGQKALKLDDRNPRLYTHLAHFYEKKGDLLAALAVLREGLERCVVSKVLSASLVNTLAHLNRTGEAIEAARQALAVFPDYLWFRLKEALLLPIVYQTTAEIDCFRQRFSSGLAALIAGTPLQTPAARRNALNGVAQHVNFYLPYQGFSDLHCQRDYGSFVHRIVTANFPGMATKLPMPSLPANTGRLRIGYASAHLCRHSVSKMYLRWLQEHDRDHFEVFVYYVGGLSDAMTEEVSRCITRFYHFPDSWEDAAKAIRSDNLHVLTYLDIGMQPVMTLLAALRLAPVQCVTWGHPVTSGLPTVSHFFSSALMEPPDGQEHYSEELITLPGIGICYQKPIVPRALLWKTRSDYGLREDCVLYLSCQSIFKYLPQHDDVYPAIAKRLPRSQFAFLTGNASLAAAFRTRLERAFAALGLVAEEYCVFLPGQVPYSYQNLNLLADVYLDTLDWSGCNTTLEAMACDLPVVTLPGCYLRGRHSYAFLKQLDATATVARDKAHYIDIAVRLGEDKAWRECVVQQVKDGYQRFYSDTSSLSALEDFLTRLVREKLREQGSG